MARRTIDDQALNSLNLSGNEPNFLEQIGGDSLTGSGFEAEEPEHDFDATELAELGPSAPAVE